MNNKYFVCNIYFNINVNKIQQIFTYTAIKNKIIHCPIKKEHVIRTVSSARVSETADCSCLMPKAVRAQNSRHTTQKSTVVCHFETNQSSPPFLVSPPKPRQKHRHYFFKRYHSTTTLHKHTILLLENIFFYL